MNQPQVQSKIAEDRFPLVAYCASSSLLPKRVTDAFSDYKVERLGRDILQIEAGERELIYVFRFGAVVFFNISKEQHQDLLSRMNVRPVPSTHAASDWLEELAYDDFEVVIRANTREVGFSEIVLPKFERDQILIAAQLIGQSCALELVESAVDAFLSQSTSYTSSLRSRGGVSASKRELLKFVGEGLATRHHLVSQLALLSEPERTWNSESLYGLYSSLWENLDFDERILAVEKKLELCNEVSQLLLGVIHTRRAEFLEVIIILLILIEVVKSFLSV